MQRNVKKLRCGDNSCEEVTISPSVRLKNTVRNAKLSSKSFLIYLHNEGDLFSQKLCPILKYLRTCTETISWNLIDDNTPLLNACRFYLQDDIIVELIEQKQSALLLFSVANDAIKLNRLYVDVDFEEDSLLHDITEQIYAVPAITSQTGIAMNKIAQHLQGVETNFQTAVTVAINEEKPLAIYLHNGQSVFSTNFHSLATTKDLSILLSHFVVFICDVESGDDSLIIENNHKLNSQFSIVRTKLFVREAGLFIYKSTSQELTADTYFSGDVDASTIYVDVYNIQKIFEEDKENRNVLVEKQSILSAIASIEATHGVVEAFQMTTLKQSIEIATSVQPSYLRKVLMIYFHVEKSPFAETFLTHLQDQDNLKRIAYSTHIIPWDLTDIRYRSVLQSLVHDQFDLQRIDKMVENGEPGLFMFVAIKNRPQLFSFLTWPIDGDDMWCSILQVLEAFEEQHEKTDIAEVTACDNSPNKEPLGDIISMYCLCANIHSRKILQILFYNNTSDKLYKNTKFAKSLLESSVLNNFYCINWNISDDTIRPKLLRAVERYFDLKNMKMLLQNKKSGLFTFMPIAESLTLFDYLDDDSSESKVKKGMLKSNAYFVKEREIEEMLPDDANSINPVQFQQLIFDQLGDRDYDCFFVDKDQGKHLKNKIGFGLFGAPVQCDEVAMLTGAEFKRYNDKQTKQIELAYEKIVEYAQKYGVSVDDIVMTCIFICLAPLPEVKLKRLKKDGNYNPRIDFQQFPIFVIRKCVEATENACRIFVDHRLRMYTSWSNYLEENKLPEGMLIVPKDGRYHGDAGGNVRVEYVVSPACGLGYAILQGVDIGATVVGLGAGAAGVAASLIAIPAAPLILTGAVVVGGAIGTYTIGRGIATLVDRAIHDETMSVTNSEARGAYFGIVGGALGFAGSGATMALGYYARSGANISMLARGAANTINGANVVINGASVANSTFEVISRWITDDEAPSALTILQLSSSILFFGHAVYNVRSANTIISEAQTQAMNDINNSLRSNRHRKTFNKMTKQTIKEAGNLQKGQAEVISYMKNLNNRDEVLAALTRNNKALNEKGIKYSVNNREIHFNGVQINIDELANLSSISRSDYVNLPPVLEPTPTSYKTMGSTLLSLETLQQIGCRVFIDIIQSPSFAVACTKLLNAFSDFIQEKLIGFLPPLLHACEIDVDIHKSLLSIFTADKIPIQLLNMIVRFFKDAIVDDERRYINDPDSTEVNQFLNRRNVSRIVCFMEKAILVASLSVPGVVRLMLKYVKDWIVELIRNRIVETDNESRPLSGKSPTSCTVCDGKYYT